MHEVEFAHLALGGNRMTTQEIDELVLKAVKAHYAEHSAPFYLAALGNLFRSQDIELPPGVRFKDYLSSRFHGRLVVIQDPEIPARIAIAEPERESAIRRQLSGQSTELADDSEVDYGRLPIALIAAFCKVPLPDSQVYFRTTKPFRYETLLHPPDDNYVEISETFRPTSLAGKSVHTLSFGEKQTVYACIEKWADANAVDLRSLYYDRSLQKRQQERGQEEAAQNALQRLINAQEPELRGRIRIPGDIASTLMRLP